MDLSLGNVGTFNCVCVRDAMQEFLVLLLLLFHLLLLLLLLGKALEMQKGYLVCLDSVNIKDLLKLETGNREKGRSETSFGLHLLWRSETKMHAHQKGTTAMRESGWESE